MHCHHRGSSFVWAVLCVLAIGCTEDSKTGPEVVGPTPKFPDPTEGVKPRAVPLRDEIPPAELEAVMSAHVRGLGHIERYEYDKAAEAFADVHERAPGWIPGSVNLAIALLNSTGTKTESEGGPAAAGEHFMKALDLLGGVLDREPRNLHARYSRGIILEYLGRLSEAHRDFVAVAERDPADAHAWYKVGCTLSDPDKPDSPAGPKQAKALIELYEKAFRLNPYLVSNLYKLQSAYSWAGDREKQKQVLDLWRQLNPKNNAAGTGDTAETFYGEMGRYALIIDPFNTRAKAAKPAIPPRFEVPNPITVSLPAGHRWVAGADFKGTLAIVGRLREQFGAAVGSFDADGDGRADLYLAAAVHGPKGIHDVLLINKGDGKFEDATAAFGLPEDRASLGFAAGDFDADRRVDLYLTGLDGNRLLRNTGKRFEDVTQTARVGGGGSISLTARWLDLDQDGDLDLYVVNYAPQDQAETALTSGSKPTGVLNAVYRNDGQPAAITGRPRDNWAPLAVATEDLPATAGLSIAFTAWQDDALTGGKSPHTAVAALDIDDDRDIDLVLSAEGARPTAVLNDRLGRFRTAELPGISTETPINGLLVADLDKDGRADLVATSASGPVTAWRNTTKRTEKGPSLGFEPFPTDARQWRAATAFDLDLDTWPDLVGLSASSQAPVPDWARNDGTRLATSPLALGPDLAGAGPLAGFVLADVAGDTLPDLVLVRPGAAPSLAKNLGNGERWLALELNGRWRVQPHMRSNPRGLGTRIALEGQGLNVLFDDTTTTSGLAQSVGPVVLGLGKLPSVALVRLRWPDGTTQSELNLAADKLTTIVENNRKPSSCPVLFTWDGTRAICAGDFLGGGGLGYLVAPGVYGQPDRDESVAITSGQLRADRGVYRLAVTEPMDEVAYLDSLALDVVDAPPGVSVTPDERFAPEGPRPTGGIVAWRTAVEPLRATDLSGRDVTRELRAWDRSTVDSFGTRVGWIGYAEEHGIVLDFGDRLARFGPNDRLTLCLAGWVEYPYSQTNYAAATAGVLLAPPTLERRRSDGTWEMIEPHAGYPAGLPRMTTLDLTGKLTGPSCTLRLKTNMECYWDQAFIAVREPEAGVRVCSLRVSKAVLAHRGFVAEASPDGRHPLLYDYEHLEPAPLAQMSGKLTRYGDVAPLLRADDDRLCILGPGDEVRLEFKASAPDLPEGWTRSYVLRTVGYCKDADPFTGTSDTIGPLPYKGMPAYPFGTASERPQDPAYLDYLRDYQTRDSGAR